MLAVSATRTASAFGYSVGFDMTEPVLDAIAKTADQDWVCALDQDCAERPNGQVCEITEHLDLQGWPTGSRVLVAQSAARTSLTAGSVRHPRPRSHLRRTRPAKPARHGASRPSPPPPTDRDGLNRPHIAATTPANAAR